MSNQQLYLAIGIPVLIGVFNTGVVVAMLLHFVNRLDARIDKLDAKIDAQGERLGAQINRLGEDYTRFYGEQRKQQEAIDILKAKVL